MKLISMTDFVLDKQRFKEDSDTAIFKITNYANFLKQPLKLEMFVPCIYANDTTIVLKNNTKFFCSNEFEKAKELILFEGFFFKNIEDFNEWVQDNDLSNIESMIGLCFTLTPNAIKQLGL